MKHWLLQSKLDYQRTGCSIYAHPSELWLIFAGIGILCIISLFLYENIIGTRDTQQQIINKIS
jgi:hypothetical protein